MELEKANRYVHPDKAKVVKFYYVHILNYPFYLCSTILIISSHSRDCGVYMLKFIEFQMMGCSLKFLIMDDQIGHYRTRCAVEIFEQGIEP